MAQRRFIWVTFGIFLFSACAFSARATHGEFPRPKVTGEKYRDRYKLDSATHKLIDNYGEGFDRLYGLRNMRAVLNGVYYRGGGNNVYNKNEKRSNVNPLPDEGLRHLCQEGATRAVYLYSDNYETAPKATRCRTFEGNENVLQYDQVSPLRYNRADLEHLHRLILDHVRDPARGPIYEHCWNGWHASGYVAATTLIQFCGFTNEQAIAYWNTNTDGHNGSEYEGVRTRLRAFTPSAGLELSAEERSVLCPHPTTLKFAGDR